jgi:hypothetical protein
MNRRLSREGERVHIAFDVVGCLDLAPVTSKQTIEPAKERDFKMRKLLLASVAVLAFSASAHAGNSVTTTQIGVVNVSSTSQTGLTNSAKLGQLGIINSGTVAQTGIVNVSTVAQFGPLFGSNSANIGQLGVINLSGVTQN